MDARKILEENTRQRKVLKGKRNCAVQAGIPPVRALPMQERETRYSGFVREKEGKNRSEAFLKKRCMKAQKEGSAESEMVAMLCGFKHITGEKSLKVLGSIASKKNPTKREDIINQKTGEKMTKVTLNHKKDSLPIRGPCGLSSK